MYFLFEKSYFCIASMTFIYGQIFVRKLFSYKSYNSYVTYFRSNVVVVV